MEIGRRTTRIARQSIWVGLGLSAVAMLVASFGGLPPIVGAAIQEVIDVAVILNALRTSMEPRSRCRAIPHKEPTKSLRKSSASRTERTPAEA
jgi:hypothetical protein